MKILREQNLVQILPVNQGGDGGYQVIDLVTFEVFNQTFGTKPSARAWAEKKGFLVQEERMHEDTELSLGPDDNGIDKLMDIFVIPSRNGDGWVLYAGQHRYSAFSDRARMEIAIRGIQVSRPEAVVWLASDWTANAKWELYSWTTPPRY